MNSKLKWIFARRSIRRYQNKDVPEKLITDLMEAAMAAPSAVQTDPWHFIIVREREMLNKIAEGLPHGKMLLKAPVGILVCGDIDQANGQLVSYMLQDCCAAIQNLLLAANTLRLGACWLGVHPREDRMDHLRAIFNLPRNITPISVISLGYPAEKAKPRTRYDKHKIHMEKW